MKRCALPMTLAVTALLLSGCTMEDGEPSSMDGPRGALGANEGRPTVRNGDGFGPQPPRDFVDQDDLWGNGSLSLNVLDARLVGSIGSVDGLAHPASEVTSYADGYWSNVTVTVDKAGTNTGAGMMILDMQGDIMALPAGVHRLNYVAPDSDEWGRDPYGSQSLFLIGCSGDNPGEWSFDQPAEDAEVIVDDRDPDVLSITFTANFGSSMAYDWQTGATREVGASSVTGTLHIAR
jgi:hypothetical protein